MNKFWQRRHKHAYLHRDTLNDLPMDWEPVRASSPAHTRVFTREKGVIPGCEPARDVFREVDGYFVLMNKCKPYQWQYA